MKRLIPLAALTAALTLTACNNDGAGLLLGSTITYPVRVLKSSHFINDAYSTPHYKVLLIDTKAQVILIEDTVFNFEAGEIIEAAPLQDRP